MISNIGGYFSILYIGVGFDGIFSDCVGGFHELLALEVIWI